MDKARPYLPDRAAPALEVAEQNPIAFLCTVMVSASLGQLLDAVAFLRLLSVSDSGMPRLRDGVGVGVGDVNVMVVLVF